MNRTILIQDILNTYFGDSNLDGQVRIFASDRGSFAGDEQVHIPMRFQLLISGVQAITDTTKDTNSTKGRQEKQDQNDNLRVSSCPSW